MDKPIECSSCKEPASVIYKQLSSQSCTQEILCKTCPLLKERLQGNTGSTSEYDVTQVSCNECATSLRDVLRHDSLGCSHCYEVFQQAICQRLNIEKLDYKQDAMINKNTTPTSEQLLKLSKDLQDAVSQENFEKAALLRDEINKLKKMMSES